MFEKSPRLHRLAKSVDRQSRKIQKKVNSSTQRPANQIKNKKVNLILFRQLQINFIENTRNGLTKSILFTRSKSQLNGELKEFWFFEKNHLFRTEHTADGARTKEYIFRNTVLQQFFYILLQSVEKKIFRNNQSIEFSFTIYLVIWGKHRKFFSAFF